MSARVIRQGVCFQNEDSQKYAGECILFTMKCSIIMMKMIKGEEGYIERRGEEERSGG